MSIHSERLARWHLQWRGTLSLREIGAVQHVLLYTVKMHSRVLYRKLGVSSRADAVDRVRQLGLL